MVDGRELHSGFRIRACYGTEQEVHKHAGKPRQRHRPVRISEPRKATRQAGCILWGFPNFLGGRSCSAVGFMRSRQGKPCLEEPSWHAHLCRQLPCSVNHPDNGNSCSASVNYFLLTSAPFHWYVWSIISTARLSLLDYAAAVAEQAEKYRLLTEITGSPQVTEGSRTVSQCWGTFTFRKPARKPASRHTTVLSAMNFWTCFLWPSCFSFWEAWPLALPSFV